MPIRFFYVLLFVEIGMRSADVAGCQVKLKTIYKIKKTNLGVEKEDPGV